MPLHGRHLIAGRPSAEGHAMFAAVDPATGRPLDPPFSEAAAADVQRACEAAEEAFEAERHRPAAERAALLDAIADRIDALDDAFVARVTAETALPEARVRGERGRTTGQLRRFADVVRRGDWVEARIETALPDRAPAPRPDLRRMLQPLGPVAVFGASNFPLAFSVAGGDTASALAAGCSVVVKGHPAHPGTSEWVGQAVRAAVADAGFHPGTFSLLQAAQPETSIALVTDPRIRAVGFTGSLRAGRALFDAAVARPDPIPVYAEMGSVNPIFLLPSALEGDTEALETGLLGSLTLGCGQFCTNPGLVFAPAGPALDAFLDRFARRLTAHAGGTMLHAGIRSGYQHGLDAWAETPGVERVALGGAAETAAGTAAAVFVTDLATFLDQPHLHEEVFGPATLFVRCPSVDALPEAAEALQGNLTATLHGTADELQSHPALVHALERRVGRLLIGGFPTGVEVGTAMHHGGPYPATTDVRSTSVGTAAIARFARPICYQNAPPTLLPPELQDENPRGIYRLVDGEFTREPLA